MGELLSQGLRLVPLLPGTKVPYKSETSDERSGWHLVFIDDLVVWSTFRASHPRCNLAVVWLGCQIDCDSRESIEWAINNDVTIRDLVWILKTARGWRLFYRSPGESLTTQVDATHHIPDLLTPGRLALVPPSIHPTGFRYRWVSGHSPLDIPLQSLSLPPEPILEFWRAISLPKPVNSRKNDASPTWVVLVFDAIYRNLESHGHKLHPTTNGGFITTCPFHDDHNPSLSLHPERGWKCFAGCGEGRLTLLAARLGVRA